MSELRPQPESVTTLDGAAVLRVEDLRVAYFTERGPVQAVGGVSFVLERGERFGIVGESGCGKSTMALALLRLLRPPGEINGGQVWLEGQNLLALDEIGMRRLRWNKLALIPQGAMNSLNPVMRVRDQISDVILAHRGPAARAGLHERIRELLAMVGLPDRVADLFPHELSGGMKQRVCIAMAVALNPVLIIADEPTSALDVVVQRVVAQTLIDVSERLGAALILIGHDMGLQAQLVDRLGVMYAGKMVEQGTIRELLKTPRHPYTQLLISSLPSIKERRMPQGIPGLPPSLLRPPAVCLFHPRCPHAMDVCRTVEPPPLEHEPRHLVACHWANGIRDDQATPVDWAGRLQ